MNDIKNKRFGRLIAVYVFGRDKHGNIIWKCDCQCGNSKNICSSSLTRGLTKSCGCINIERISKIGKLHKKHGESGKTPEYSTWKAMIKRCTNPNNKDYQYYGGRGIKVCKRWRKSFKNFLKDMGRKPTSYHSIDRKNNNKDYKPSNCRWATMSQQRNNRCDT